MKSLIYYEFSFIISESNVPSSPFYNTFQNKIFSKMRLEYKSKDYLQNRLFSPKNNNYYRADQKIPDEIVSFYDFYLSEDALVVDDFMKATEINSSLGFFVSPKVKDILNNLVLPSHRYHPVKIISKKDPVKSYDYYFLLIAKNELKINYQKSTFVERFNKSKEVSVLRYEDLLKIYPANENGPASYTNADIKEKKIVFNEAPDIYPIVTGGNAFFYFSERLKSILEKENITGYDLYEAEKPLFFLNK